MDKAICASCGQEEILCQSIRESGIKQPRFCKKCLLKELTEENVEINPAYWYAQMIQLNDEQSLNAIKKMNQSENNSTKD